MNIDCYDILEWTLQLIVQLWVIDYAYRKGQKKVINVVNRFYDCYLKDGIEIKDGEFKTKEPKE